jgi:5'-3' exonuclease
VSGGEPARVHVVDSTWELFRAHYSKAPGHQDPEGRPRKATVGLVRSLLALLDDPDEAVTHVAVAFDRPIRSFRNRLFDGYKTEAGMDPELLEQLEPAEQATAALGVRVWQMIDHEADDGMATAAARFASERCQVRILSPDKDLAQCLDAERVVQVDRMRKRVKTEAELRAERGFGPESVPHFLALVGDAADGIPGLPGFGEKTAAALLAAHPSVDAIPDDPTAWGVKVRGAAGLAETLRLRREDARLYARLATLVTDAPIDASVEALHFRGTERETWAAWCRAVGAPRLLDRPRRWREA